jgi:Cu/Ag efflux protein CusF
MPADSLADSINLGRPDARRRKRTTAADAETRHQARGPGPNRKTLPSHCRVVSIDGPNQSINIDGDAIPGLMAAMTMPYSVKDAAALAKLSPGDRIKAEIVVGDEDADLENISGHNQGGVAVAGQVKLARFRLSS